MRKLIVIVVLLVLGGGLGVWYWQVRANPGTPFRTAPVTRGNLQANIGATGIIQPEEVIDVGAQVAGRIEKFGADLRNPDRPIDYGAVVDKGTVLAQLDSSLYKAQVDSAEADLKRAQADLLQKQAQLKQTTADLKRATALLPSNAISQADFDAAKAAFEVAQANVGVSQAQIGVSEGSLALARTNLDYTTIRSPVKGVIIDRRVNVGQTVVASLQAPSLFLIAKDLHRLEIWASVNEADIGQMKIGQTVKFTVDAHPGRVFEGKVLRQGDFPARLNASMTQNVVTYTVVVSIDNEDGLLWPYLTANLQFIVSEKSDVLLVPNAALRYKPRLEQIVPEARAKMTAKAEKNKEEQNRGTSQGNNATAVVEKEDSRGIVWVVQEGFVRPVRVRLGHTDGVNTEILGGGLADGTEVVVGEGRVAQATGDANPFAPQLFGGKK
jgi:HlyD family secretion protein